MGNEERKVAKAEARAQKKAKKAEKKAWKRARPKGEPWVSPILFVSDVRAAATFYEKAFGFTIDMVLDGPDGKAVHAMVRHRRGVIMLGPPGAAGQDTPKGLGASSTGLYVYVANVDLLVGRAVPAGCILVSAPENMFWGDRCARLTDPEGHVWMFATHLGESAVCDAVADEDHEHGEGCDHSHETDEGDESETQELPASMLVKTDPKILP